MCMNFNGVGLERRMSYDSENNNISLIQSMRRIVIGLILLLTSVQCSESAERMPASQVKGGEEKKPEVEETNQPQLSKENSAKSDYDKKVNPSPNTSKDQIDDKYNKPEEPESGGKNI